jgi:molecular chaperone DnaK (HSP70)
MSNNVVIGLDLGSHHASIAIWDEEKDRIEVIADDLGSRTIPTVVAFRGDEILVGQAASSQEHKNVSNTFPDVLSKMMFSGETPKISIPALDGREVSTRDLHSCTLYHMCALITFIPMHYP